jgi:hypothetical protein
MKRWYFTAIMFLGVVSVNAQKVTNGSFSVLANETAVSLCVDYTDSKIDKVPFDVFLEGESKWEEAYKDISFKLVKEANRHSDGLKYLTKKTENYQLVFKAITVDDDGETRGNLLLLDKEGNVIGTAEKFDANGGRFGSQTNLMGDAAERLGKKIAQFIKKQIK